MYRGTTPTLRVKLTTSILAEDIVQLYLTVENSSKELTWTIEDLEIQQFPQTETDPAYIEVIKHMTQEETLSFKSGRVTVQARILTRDGSAYASNMKPCSINDILKDGEIHE